MLFKGKFRIIDNDISICDYDYILTEIQKSIKRKKTFLVSPIASHTLVRAHYDKRLQRVLSGFDHLLPDSQWVRWSAPFLYGNKSGLDDRVYGPKLMSKLCKLSSKKGYRIFLYGNTAGVLSKLEVKLIESNPRLVISGKEESKFRELKEGEWKKLEEKIIKSKPDIIFVSLGSPKQELFSQNLASIISKPLAIIPVGAAFDFLSKNKPQAPESMQSRGLEWLFRLLCEPGRLFARYVFYGVLFIFLILLQKSALLFRRRN